MSYFVKSYVNTAFRRIFSSHSKAVDYAWKNPGALYVEAVKAPRSSHLSGHCADGGGVQAHSAGGLYPFILVAQDSPIGLQWGVLEPGKANPARWFAGRGAYDGAQFEAERLVAVERCGRCANSYRHLLHPKCGLCDGNSQFKAVQS